MLAQPAWPLTFRAPRLSRPPDCLPGGRRVGGGREKPGRSPPASAHPCPLSSPLLSTPVWELINLSPVGKLERRSRGRLSLTLPAPLPGHAKPCCGWGHWCCKGAVAGSRTGPGGLGQGLSGTSWLVGLWAVGCLLPAPPGHLQKGSASTLVASLTSPWAHRVALTHLLPMVGSSCLPSLG